MTDPDLLANMDRCPAYASFFGAMGCALAIILTTFGAAYGTANSSVAIFASGILRPDRLIENTLCAIMAQILSIYGLVVGVIIANTLKEKMALYTGFMQFGAGMSVGLCGLSAGFAIGIVGDAGGESRSVSMAKGHNHSIKEVDHEASGKFVPVPSNHVYTLVSS